MLYGPANLSLHVYSLCHPCSVILVIAHHRVYRTISQQPWVLPSGLSDLMWFDVAQLESPAIKLQNGRCHWSSSGWCFGTFCIFHNIWDNPSHWLIFFKMVETTNQLFLGSTPRGGRVFFHVCALWQYTCLTLLPTVRWRYRRHVAQLCCWRLATLTGRGGGGGDDNVPFDCKNTMLYSDGALAWAKVSKEMRKGFRIKQVSHRRQEFLRGRNIGTQIADSRWKSMQSWIPKTVKTLYRGRLNKKLMIYVRSWQFRFAHQHQYIQTLGKLFKTKNADWKSTEEKRMHWTSGRCCGIAKSFFWHFDLLQQTSKHHRSQP